MSEDNCDNQEKRSGQTSRNRASAVSLKDPCPSPPAESVDYAKGVYFACDDFAGLTNRLGTILKREFDGEFNIEAAIGHPSLTGQDVSEIRRVLSKGYQVFFLESIYIRKRGENCEYVDLSQMQTLFGPTLEKATSVLFECEKEEESDFSWAALTQLIAQDHEVLMSWGDGAISNRSWLIKAPRVTGILAKTFSSEEHPYTDPPVKPYDSLFQTDGYIVCDSIQEKSREKINTLRIAWVISEKEQKTIPVDAIKLEGLLRVFKVSVDDLGEVKVLFRGREEPVLFMARDQVRASLMPLRGAER